MCFNDITLVHTVPTSLPFTPCPHEVHLSRSSFSERAVSGTHPVHIIHQPWLLHHTTCKLFVASCLGHDSNNKSCSQPSHNGRPETYIASSVCFGGTFSQEWPHELDVVQAWTVTSCLRQMAVLITLSQGLARVNSGACSPAWCYRGNSSLCQGWSLSLSDRDIIVHVKACTSELWTI